MNVRMFFHIIVADIKTLKKKKQFVGNIIQTFFMHTEISRSKVHLAGRETSASKIIMYVQPYEYASTQ